MGAGELGDSAGGFFKEFVDEGLVGLGLPGGHAAEATERGRRKTRNWNAETRSRKDRS